MEIDNKISEIRNKRNWGVFSLNIDMFLLTKGPRNPGFKNENKIVHAK